MAADIAIVADNDPGSKGSILAAIEGNDSDSEDEEEGEADEDEDEDEDDDEGGGHRYYTVPTPIIYT